MERKIDKRKEKARLIILEAINLNGLANNKQREELKKFDRVRAEKLLGRKLIEDEIA